MHAQAFHPLDWALIALIAGMWGSSFLLMAEALEDFNPGLIVLVRLIFGASIIAVLPVARRRLPRHEWPRILFLAVMWMTVPWTLVVIAQQHIDTAVNGMLMGSMPLFTMLFASMLLRRAPGPAQLAGMALGLAGVLAISLPAATGASTTALGVGLVLMATSSYGLATNIAVPLQQRYGALPVLLNTQLLATVLVLPFGLASAPGASFSITGLLAVAALGIFATGTATALFTTLIGRVGAARGATAVYFVPLVAIVMGVLFRSETVATSALIGVGGVLAGAYLMGRADQAAQAAQAGQAAQATARAAPTPDTTT